MNDLSNVGFGSGVLPMVLYILAFFVVAAAIIGVVVLIAKYNRKLSGDGKKFICPKCGALIKGNGGVCNKCGFRFLQNDRSWMR